MILSGEKKEEYREIKPYWNIRFKNAFGLNLIDGKIVRASSLERQKNQIQCIAFRNGYQREAATIWAECSIDIGYGRKEWGAEVEKEYYILKIKRIVGIKE